MDVHVNAAITAGMRRRGIDVLTAGKYVLDLEVVCKVLDPEDMVNRIEYLPLE